MSDGFHCTNYNRESQSFLLKRVSRLGKMISSFLIHNTQETDPEVFWRVEMKHVPDVLRCPCAESVKYMIVSLFWTLHANPRLLQQIVRDKTAHNCILKTRWTRLVTTWSLPHSCLQTKTKFTFSLKWISTNFPNRLLLLFLTVFAFPKASSKGLAAWNRHIPNIVFALYAKIKH